MSTGTEDGESLVRHNLYESFFAGFLKYLQEEAKKDPIARGLFEEVEKKRQEGCNNIEEEYFDLHIARFKLEAKRKLRNMAITAVPALLAFGVGELTGGPIADFLILDKLTTIFALPAFYGGYSLADFTTKSTVKELIQQQKKLRKMSSNNHKIISKNF